MRKTKKLFIAAVSIIILCVGAYSAKYFLDVMKYKSIINKVSINEIDLSKVSDGSYTGSFDAIFIESKVNVIVKDHKIVDIKLLSHKNERGQKAEDIPQRVVQAQSLQVDAVSGATNSSKVILKSIENALANGEKDK